MSSLSLLFPAEARGFAPDLRFVTMGAPVSEAPEPATDPVEEAYARGHADGLAEAMGFAEQRATERDYARNRIQLALERLDEQHTAELQEKLRQTVLILCEEAVAPLAIDPQGLSTRIERAVSMLRRKQDEAVVRLHPEDLALIGEQLPASLCVEPDDTLERGALRIDTADGGIEDGPAHWRRIMAEALRAC